MGRASQEGMTMTARQYLMKLQTNQTSPGTAANPYDAEVRRRYVELMGKVQPDVRKKMEENLRMRDASDAKYAARLPTPLQSLQDFRRLLEAKDSIDVTLRAVGEYQPVDNLVLGSVETDRLNAMATFTRDSSEYLIVFNRGLLLSLLAVSNLFVWATSMKPKLAPGEALDVIAADKVVALAPRYGTLLASVSHGGVPAPDTTIALFPWPEKEIRWTKLEDAAMEFAFAHEYAHILRGHLSSETEEFREDRGGWGHEYEADSLALDFVAQTWLEAERKHFGAENSNPILLGLVLQGVGMFYVLLCQIEQYLSEVRGKPAGIWSSSRSHPPTYVRWIRMLDKVRGKTPAKIWEMIILPQVTAMEKCLDAFYFAAVGDRELKTPTAVEWRFQRIAFEALRQFCLVPAHLFIGSRCARAAIARGTVLDDASTAVCAASADSELEAAGARPVRDYGYPLNAFSRGLADAALRFAGIVGTDRVRQFTDRLAEVCRLDALTRYPVGSGA
jgi:hypothetical protein